MAVDNRDAIAFVAYCSRVQWFRLKTHLEIADIRPFITAGGVAAWFNPHACPSGFLAAFKVLSKTVSRWRSQIPFNRAAA